MPQKPTTRFEGYVEGSYGNYDMKRLQGVVNVPLGERARARIGADWQERDGYLRNILVGPSRLGNTNHVAVRGSLVLDLTPDLENYTIFSYSRSNTNGAIPTITNCNTNFPQTPALSAAINFGALCQGSLARQQG